MVKIESANKTHTVTDYHFEIIRDLINGIDPFDLDVILEAMEGEKFLHTPDKAIFQ